MECYLSRKESSVFSDHMDGENYAKIKKPGTGRQMLNALTYIYNLKQ